VLKKKSLEVNKMAKDDMRQRTNVMKEFDKEGWIPKTELGKQVKSGEITNIDIILNEGKNILEDGIVDCLIPSLEAEMIEIGQSKGKFGGGKRSIWRQTQKKTKEGNKPKFATMIIIGNKNGYIGIGNGKGKETMPAREKATRQAKLNIQKIVRGCGSWECGCEGAHTIPFKVSGKCGSAEITLMPAPRGVGLCVEKQCKKMLEFAGLKDVYSKTKGQTKSKINLMNACFAALKQLSSIKISESYIKVGGVVDGKIENGK
jgi:small subunit ribosomal protein S5